MTEAQQGLPPDTKAVLSEVRDDLLLLSLVSAVQPVDPEALVSQLPKRVDASRFSAAIDRALADGRILRLRDGRVMVSYEGRKAFGMGPLSKERDITRMFQLIAEAKEG